MTPITCTILVFKNRENRTLHIPKRCNNRCILRNSTPQRMQFTSQTAFRDNFRQYINGKCQFFQSVITRVKLKKNMNISTFISVLLKIFNERAINIAILNQCSASINHSLDYNLTFLNEKVSIVSDFFYSLSLYEQINERNFTETYK